MKKSTKSLFVTLLITVECVYIFYAHLQHPYDEKFYQKIVEILPKTSVYEIGVLLEHEKFISSPLVFLLYAKLSGVSSQLKAGRYFLSSRLNIPELLKKLKTGAEAASIRVTIPEGYTVLQIAETLQQKGIGNAEDFLQSVKLFAQKNAKFANSCSLEGYLFPDTYFFYPGMPPEKIINKMYERFCNLVYPLYSQYTEKTKLSLHEVVVLASLIEKEAQKDEEKKIISGVFHNRLKKGMPLGCEPTVRYILNKFSGPLTKEELAIDSPYNTYKVKGLPPSPICNPGLKSLEAALAPAKVDYLYFVARDDGTHQFSYTLNQHQLAINRYRKRITNKEENINITSSTSFSFYENE